MNVSGYDRTFRTSVIHAAVKIYNYKVDVSNQGGRPLYRPAGVASIRTSCRKTGQKADMVFWQWYPT